MCGLVGVAGNIPLQIDKIFKTLLVLDTLRGEDSTGVAFIHKDRANPLSIAKVIGDPFALFETNAYSRGIAKPNRVIIGHNRYATQGKVNRANAHPFEYGDIVGAHNGTLNNKHVLKDGYHFDVDSQALINHIDKEGIESAIKGLNGAWALTWWDQGKSTMNFLRNDQRPLYLCESEDSKTVLWASEAWMLEIACAKQNLKIKNLQLLPINTHFAIDIDQAGVIGDVREEEVKSSYVPFQQNTVHHFPTQTQGTTQGTMKTTPNGGQTTVKELPGIEPRAGFAGTKRVKLNCQHTGQDSDGALFIVCKEIDSVRAQGEIRLYIHKHDLKMVGQNIIADINEKATYQPKKGLIYKVMYSSVSPLEEAKVEEKKGDDADASDNPFLTDHRGNFIDRATWYKRYGTCSACNGDVSHDSGFKFVKNDAGAFCEDCVTDPQTQSYLSAYYD